MACKKGKNDDLFYLGRIADRARPTRLYAYWASDEEIIIFYTECKGRETIRLQLPIDVLAKLFIEIEKISKP